MPDKAVKRKGVWRVVESDSGRVTKNAAGTAVDGGGHPTEAAARKQIAAINAGRERQVKRDDQRKRRKQSFTLE